MPFGSRRRSDQATVRTVVRALASIGRQIYGYHSGPVQAIERSYGASPGDTLTIRASSPHLSAVLQGEGLVGSSASIEAAGSTYALGSLHTTFAWIDRPGLTPSWYVVYQDPTPGLVGAAGLTLPRASYCTRAIWRFKNIEPAATSTVTLYAGDTILDTGTGSIVIPALGSLALYCTGAGWWIVG